ncbi:putative ribonuclease H-like domain-containing protein [Tanacetum coccineum]
MYIASLKKSENYKAQPYKYASPSKQILKAKAKPFPPCTHCSFNDHRRDDCRNYHECEIYRSYDHFTLGHNCVILIRGEVLAESSQSIKSSIGVKCDTCGSTRHIREPIWYLDSGCSRSMTGVKIYLHKYVEQPVPKDSLSTFGLKQSEYVGIKRLLNDLRVTAVKWDQQVVSELVALRNFAKKTWIKTQYIWWLHQKYLCSNLNRNAPLITKLVEGVETIIAPSTVEEKAQRRLELKARSTLLMSIPNENQLKFNPSKDTKSLLQAVEKSTNSTNGVINTAHGVTTASTQATTVNSTIIDNLSDVVICAFFSDQAEEGPTNFALMAYSSTSSNSKVSTDSNCSSSCLENVKILKEQNEQLLKDLRTSKINAITYKTGLESVEARLLVYKKNESVYEEDIKLLKRKIYLKEVAVTELRRKLELAQKQKDEIQLTVEKYENSSKSLSKLIDCQIVDKCKTGLGYNAVPPPYTGNFMPLKPDLSFSSLEEFKNEPIVSEPTVKKLVVETSEAKDSADKPKVVKKNNGALIIKDWVFDSEEKEMPQDKIQKKTVKPSFAKIEFVKSKKQVKSPRKITVKQGSNFEMINKACYVCGSFDHLQYDCNNHQRQVNNKKMVKLVWNYTQRVNHQNFSIITHPIPKRNMLPKAVLMRSDLVSLTTARPVNTTQPRSTVNSARPMTNVFNTTHSTVRRPSNNKTTTKNSNFNQGVNTSKHKNVNTARPKAVVNTGKPKAVLNDVKGNQVNTGNPQMDLQDQGVIDSGCSRHMTRNMSYLTNFEEIDGGYVAFGGNPKGGKIIGRGTIKTGNLDFENVYFLTDESHVLLKVSRKNNMYSVDLKNIVPKGGLTCLFAKATSDESKLWHRRLGHINFKTMNKLVKGNLVRGLPSKLFKNDQTCVACQKGKQHRASCKSKIVSSISQPLHMLHMDLFGLTFVKSLMKKMYCLVVTDDYSRISWVFFLATKDETSGILMSFITGVENLIDQMVKVIRCDNGTKFKNKEMNQFCERKGIKREFSVARTPQQNRVAKRKNRTLIEAARTMLADSKLHTTFWAEPVNTACYV